MIQVLENEFLKIHIDDHGAELISIWDKEKEHEVIWQADPAFWKRHAPVLFPNVGSFYKKSYRLDGKTYQIGQHGFARDMEFSCISCTENRAAHRLCSDAATREKYPFDFVLDICHTLSGRELTIHWKVTNKSGATMYFSIGGHPAFRVPVLSNTKRSDYRLVLKGTDCPKYCLLDPGTGTADVSALYPMELDADCSCPIGDHLFDKDALIFDGQISAAGILNPDGSPYVTVTCEDFPNFGVWSAKNAPFVCLEPWCGRCDNLGYEGELAQKPFINSLLPEGVFEKSYSIRIF